MKTEIKIAGITANAADNFRALEGKGTLKVNLGCGPDIRPGWVNVDLALTPRVNPASHANATFINHDLRLGLPLEEGSCNYVYSSHFFEHLEHDQGARLMRDCYRALRPGGVFRIVLPDLRKIFEAYLKNDERYFDLLDPFLAPRIDLEKKSLIDYVNYGVYQFSQHKFIYDEEKLRLILRDIGYGSVTPSEYQEDVGLDVAVRRHYSFYTEAVK